MTALRSAIVSRRARLSVRPRVRGVVFDLDGTLLRGTTVSLYLAAFMGDARSIAELETQFARGQISNRRFAEMSAEWFTDCDVRRVWRYLEAAPWISGMGATFSLLRTAGIKVAVATVTWRFASEMLRSRYQLDACSGTEMMERDGILLGKVTRYFDEYDKLAFVQDWSRQHGFAMKEVAAVGDARSDIPVFRNVGLGIALNGTKEARAEAHVSVDNDDLRIVLPQLLGSTISDVRRTRS